MMTTTNRFVLLTTLVLTIWTLLAIAIRPNKNLIKDPGFEMIPTSDNRKYDFTDGTWTYEDNLIMFIGDTHQSCSEGAGFLCTPYGRQFTYFYNPYQSSPTQPYSGTLSQNITGLRADTKYNYTFAYNLWYVPKAPCNITSSVAGTVIDQFVVSGAGKGPQVQVWNNRSTVFTSTGTDGLLEVRFYCGIVTSGSKSFAFYYDQVSLSAFTAA